MKKVLFIDRDGTLIVEPPSDFQIDSLEKLEFLPGAISAMRLICQSSDYELAMVSNQDGLGTESFPEDTFWPAHQKMLKTFENEGVVFDEIFIDKSFEADGLPTRKPGLGMLSKYLDGSYDLGQSFVIGDRISDIQLAKNLGAKAIFVGKDDSAVPEELKDIVALTSTHWNEIAEAVCLPHRKISWERNTHETQIKIDLDLDGTGKAHMDTGLGFFNHMLDQVAKHSGIDLAIKVKGDLHIDEHHTIEDTGLALGEAFAEALGQKRGISRYGFLLPMDEALAQVGIDFSGRPWLVWDATFTREKVGDMPTEMFFHFFKSFSDTSKTNLNIKCEGDNEHHKIEAIFKAFAKAIKMAIHRDINRLDVLPSTKGVL